MVPPFMNKYDYRTSMRDIEERSKERGRREGKREDAKNMLAEGFEPALIARITKLPKARIMALKRT